MAYRFSYEDEIYFLEGTDPAPDGHALRKILEIGDDYDLWQLTKTGPHKIWSHGYLDFGDSTHTHLFTTRAKWNRSNLQSATFQLVTIALVLFALTYSVESWQWAAGNIFFGSSALLLNAALLQANRPSKTEAMMDNYMPVGRKLLALMRKHGYWRVAAMMRETMIVGRIELEDLHDDPAVDEVQDD